MGRLLNKYLEDLLYTEQIFRTIFKIFSNWSTYMKNLPFKFNGCCILEDFLNIKKKKLPHNIPEIFSQL